MRRRRVLGRVGDHVTVRSSAIGLSSQPEGFAHPNLRVPIRPASATFLFDSGEFVTGASGEVVKAEKSL